MADSTGFGTQLKVSRVKKMNPCYAGTGNIVRIYITTSTPLVMMLSG